VDEGRSIRFVLSDRSNRKSEATGQLMWKDTAGKRCGLQFTEVSSELRAMIQSCLGQDGPGVAGSTEPLPESLEVPDSFPTQVHAGIFDDLPMPKSSPRRGSFIANATTLLAAALIAFAIWYNLGGFQTSSSLSRVKQHVSSFLFSKVNHIPFGWTTRLKSQPVAPAAKKAESPAVETAAMPSAVPKIEPKIDASAENAIADPQPASTSANIPTQSAVVPAPAVVPPSVTGASAAAKPAILPSLEKPIKPIKKVPEPVAAQPQPTPIAPAPVETEQPGHAASQESPTDGQVAQARKLLAREGDPVNQSKGIQILWQAVAKGNPAAEVELAGLYLRGRGVSKSCSQALILLKAAQSKRSPAAAQELSNFPRFGCGAPDDSSASSSSPNGAQ
jgi:hypothetical protein